MTEDQVQRLRDAGISEEVIIDMQKKKEEERSPGYIDPATPSTTFNQAQAAGAPTQGPEQSMAQTGAEIAVLTPDILKYATAAGLGAGAYKLGKQFIQNRPPAQPVQPTTFTGGANPAFDKALSRPPAGPGIIQRGMDIAAKMREAAAARVLPIMPTLAKGAGAIGGMLYSPSLNTGEAEQLAEYRRRTGQQP